MKRPARAAPFAIAASMLVAACEREPEFVPDRQEGDVATDLRGLDPDALRIRAQAFLASDRPWRAAMAMRSIAQSPPSMAPDDRVLAARAEAAWGAWPQVAALLDGVAALDTYEHGVGLFHLGRARDELGDAAGAVDAYRAFLALSPPAGELEAERAAARLRLGLALIRTGDRAGARTELQRSAQYAGGAAIWLELLEAQALAAVGDTAAVRQLVAGHDDGVRGLRAWRARVAAAWNAGDVAAARTAANQARAWARTDYSRSEFLVTAGRAAVEMGDVTAGRAAFRAAIDLSPATPSARQAAELLTHGTLTSADHLAVARVYRAQGLHAESLDGYRRWLQAGQGTPAERSAVQFEYANALFYAERYDEVGPALRPIAAQAAARFLHARAEAHRGDFDAAVRIYLNMAEQFSGTSNGAQALYLAASTRHDEGDLPAARDLYGRVVARYSGASQMGLSLMRLAQIAFIEDNYAEAARLWDQYRTRYPRGTLNLEATYWAARARELAGNEAGAAELYRAVRQRERDSYYAMLASERLGVPFWPLPLSAAPGENVAAAQRVGGWMRGIDLLRDAGFPDDASAEADRVVAAAGRDRPTLYALAEALIERGYSQRAIRIGLGLQGSSPPDRRLLRILYPFSYRTLITEEARDRDFDPFVAAALIRQESMFEARITSPAGARGLMQIMPATGRELAAAAGVEPWDGELLYQPEINVHLGTRYVARHLASYDGDLISVFAAYNAGWHRVEMWQAFPEHGTEVMAERIPFRETRDYVRILSRNLALYRGLYGDDG